MPCTSLSEANEQLRADMRVMHWCFTSVHRSQEERRPPPHEGRRLRQNDGVGRGAGQPGHFQQAPQAQFKQEEEVNQWGGEV